ncbi:amino acid ABC transporter permease [Agrobacterium radiobacter]|uniref:amino acid ABC transporter permease n=1 Tax=Agrobacterium radiobacter TaxID=362 RepID=UPI000F988D6C
MDINLFIKYGPALLSGFGMTILCWGIGTICGAVAGFMIAIIQRYSNGFVRVILQTYIEVIRGTPFLVQLFLLYYGGPHFGLRLGSLEAGLVGLIIYGSPYFAEIFRAGFQSVPHGQIEAARAMSFSEASIIRRIMIPILLVSTLPALTNFAIILTKETVILSVVTVPELLYQVQTMSAETFAFVEANLVLALFFWIFVETISRFGRMLETRITHYLIK